MPIMIPLKKASELTGMSYEFLRKLCIQGKVRCIRSGTKWFVHYEKLIAYLESGEDE